ncbi:VOC family protein [Amphritea balenae]|nr:VOC family protein [Amphritea balenae]GGK70405.1 hypothetical protein GCM10007941_20800 [Amphritea balenae]
MPRLTHIALHVADLQACIGFYSDYCRMAVIHHRDTPGHKVVWMAEPGREKDLIIVLLEGGPERPMLENDYSHLGFAMTSKAEVDRVARQAELNGDLIWPPVQEAYPVGYYCGLRDPNGNYVEFSYGQPLGPGA